VLSVVVLQDTAFCVVVVEDGVSSHVIVMGGQLVRLRDEEDDPKEKMFLKWDILFICLLINNR
jgi:hypothetical protein